MLGLEFGVLTVLLGPIALLQEYANPAAEWLMAVTLRATIGVSFAIFFTARSKRFSDATVLWLGLAFEILL
ncbi:MAG: hypothetical protein ACJAYU_003438 [Bradymonadia bacterium]|jgi:hypothetical protein